MSKFISTIGDYLIFNLLVLVQFPQLGKRLPQIMKQMKRVGYDSLFLITITSAFTGLVTSVQASYQTSGYIPESLIGVLVGKATMIELAPVLTGLVLTGKIGASMAAEVGTMKVNEELDALRSMAIEPLSFIHFPRILASAIMVPLLEIYAVIVGIFSAYWLSIHIYGINGYTFFSNMRNFFQPSDLWGGVLKALIFGIIIASIGCFVGSKTQDGAEGVGRAATLTVVTSSIMILVMDFVVAAFLFGNF
ncbi:MAG: ABC transporter permease [Candidatus Cloacimonadales bacterium]